MVYSVTSGFKNPDERERLLKFYLEILREDAGWCSRATNEILKCHVHFADLMAQRIEGASKSWLRGFRSDDSEKTSRLANDINKASRSLSEHVADMQKNLSSFVSILEKVQVTAREQQSLVGRILGWLKSLFKAIVKVFVTLGTLISPFPLLSAAPGASGTAPVSSTLGKAAATFCGATSGAFLEHTVPYKDGNNRLLMQNSRRGKNLRASSPYFYSSRRSSQGKHKPHKRN